MVAGGQGREWDPAMRPVVSDLLAAKPRRRFGLWGRLSAPSVRTQGEISAVFSPWLHVRRSWERVRVRKPAGPGLVVLITSGYTHPTVANTGAFVESRPAR